MLNNVLDIENSSSELECSINDGSFLQESEKTEYPVGDKPKQEWKVYFGF